MKYIILIAIFFSLPFLPRWFAYFERAGKKEKAKRAKIEAALKILELSATATGEEIKAAHKRLIQKNHPDAGGSQDFASKINEARDVLLNSLKT